MIQPKNLKKGDKVGIVSTARKISQQELEPAILLLESWGLKVELGPHLFFESHQFAGTDEQRLADLQNFMDDSDIKAILCARGGYGTVRIIDELNFLAFQNQPKWIAGYSDVTVLLNTLYNKGFESLHSSMPISFPTNTEDALNSLKKALFGESLDYKIPSHPLNRSGKAQGRLNGGNLSMLYSQTGSPSALKLNNDILFIEDLDEYLYHIDRMLRNLKRNGYFNSINGLIVGGMSDMNDNSIPFGSNAEEIIREIVEPYNFPVAFGFPAGHLDNNCTLVFGRPSRLDVSSEVSLKIDNGKT